MYLILIYLKLIFQLNFFLINNKLIFETHIIDFLILINVLCNFVKRAFYRFSIFKNRTNVEFAIYLYSIKNVTQVI